MLFIQPVSTIEGQDTDSTSDLLYWSHRSASTVQFKVKTVQQNFLLVSLLSQYSTIQGQDSTVQGQDSSVQGQYSTVEGQDSKVQGQDSTVQGQ